MKLFQTWTNKAYRLFGLGLSAALLSLGGVNADCCHNSSSSSSSCSSSSSSSSEIDSSCSSESHSCTTCTDGPTDPRAIDLAAKLTECFWRAVQRQTGPCISEKVKEKISGAFIGFNPDFDPGLLGSRPFLERCGYLDYLRLHKITSFEILGNGTPLFARWTRDHKDLTVYYALHTTGYIFGTVPLQTFEQTTDNLDVWKRGQDGKWRLLSHIEAQLPQ